MAVFSQLDSDIKMKACNNCGAANESGATFCCRCGKEFTAPSKIPVIDDLIGDLNITPTMKKAGIAILLNLLLWGLGYWYLGCKKVYGREWYLLSVAWLVVGIVSSILPFLGIIIFTATCAMSYDLYEKASGRPGFVPAN